MLQCVNIISLNLSWQTSVGGRVYRHSRLLPLVDTPIAPVYTGVSRLKQEILTNEKAVMRSRDQYWPIRGQWEGDRVRGHQRVWQVLLQRAHLTSGGVQYPVQKRRLRQKIYQAERKSHCLIYFKIILGINHKTENKGYLTWAITNGRGRGQV